MAILFWKYKKCNYICIKQKTNSNFYRKYKQQHHKK